ncbi:MAG: ribbon-helix-helix protein, CopG family [Bryobacteraceae bacterium]
MKINFEFVEDPSIKALLERFYEVAEARGITRDEALRQALSQWIKSRGGGGGATGVTLDVTQKEFALIHATLDALREQKGAADQDRSL